MGQHGPFGHGLCATGVHNLSQVLAGQTRFGQGILARSQFVKVVHARDGLGVVFRGQPNKLFDLRFQHCGLLGQFCQATVSGQSFSASMAQDISHFIGLQHEIDGHHDRAHASQRKPQGGKTVRVSSQHGHPISRLHTLARKASGKARHQRIKFCVSPSRLTAHNAQLLRQTQSGAPQCIGNGLAPDSWRNKGLCCS